MCDQQSLRSACAYAQSNQSLCWLLEYSQSVKLLTEHHFEFLSLKGGSTGLSEFIHVKMPHCCKSHVVAQTVSLIWASLIHSSSKRLFIASETFMLGKDYLRIFVYFSYFKRFLMCHN